MSQDYIVGPRGPGGTTNAGNGAAIYLPRRHHPPVMIQNTGAVTLYANDEDPVSAPSPGQPITAGSTLNWDKDRPLYVTCPTSTTITITQNSGGLFDVGALSTQIANNITASGLATAIAGSIVASGLTAANIAADIKISGAPPIDNFQAIGNYQQFINNGSASPILDMRTFQSLFVGVTNTGGITAGQFLVFWYADQFASNVIELDAVYMGTGFNTQFSMAAKGPYCQINIGATGGSATMSTYGSYKSLTNNYYGCQGTGANNGNVDLGGPFGVSTWSGVIPVSTTTWIWQPDVIAGRAQLSLRFVGSGTMTMLVRMPLAIAPVTTYKSETALAITATSLLSYDLILPPAPVEISMQNPSATNTLTFRATLVATRPYTN